jgi:HEPN domain-containing protein
MPDQDSIHAVLAEWVEKAEHDLKTASHLLRLGRECPTDIVCFHAQQCVEKYLKAILVLEQIPFPKTHDLEQVSALLPSGCTSGLDIDQQHLLTRYATAARYPGWRDIPLAEARQAVALARRVQRAVRKRLPKNAPKRRKA